MTRRYWMYFSLYSIIIATGCNKQNEWLDEKPILNNVVPESLQDYQAILDVSATINQGKIGGLVGTDNVYVRDEELGSLQERERNLYFWNPAIWMADNSMEWELYYQIIEQSNIVFDGLASISDQPEKSNVEGQALFHRSLSYYHLAQLFCKPYDASTAATDLGLPLRTSSDVTRLEQRSSLQQVYDQITADAQRAADLLPEHPKYLRPGKWAAKALLAKIYFTMEHYSSAELLAIEVLEARPELVDYNNGDQVSLNNAYGFLPYGKNNPEILFYAEGTGFSAAQNYQGSPGYVPEELYNLYEDNDLRKSIFFIAGNGGYNYFGSYTGTFYPFYGIAANEVYLILAECKARSGAYSEAMMLLNQLLEKRYATGTFTPLVAGSADEALEIILRERRKELPLTSDIRWEDLRRLNKDPRFEKTLTRVSNGTEYVLAPNSPLYVLPIPDNEIQMSGIEQNAR